MKQQFMSMGLLISVMIFLSIMETFMPGQRRASDGHPHLAPNIALMMITFTLNATLNIGAVAFAEYIHVYQYAFIKPQLPFWAFALLSIACLDFFAYLAHRLMHIIPLLWRVHRVHHSDLVVDVTTAYRQHPLEGFWRTLFTILPAWMLGIPAEIIVLYKSLSALFAIFEHVNIQIRQPLDANISKLFVTPNMHKIHHSRKQIETDSNYGNILSIYDRGLGTFIAQKNLHDVDYGIDGLDARQFHTLPGLLRLPFRQAKDDVVRP